MIRFVAIALVLSFSAGSSWAQSDVQLEQALRAASRFEAIAQVCPSLIPTDVPRARRYAQVYVATAEKIAREQAKEMMPAEVMRRISEVGITGEQRWCEDQRRFLNEVGASEVFPTAGRRRR